MEKNEPLLNGTNGRDGKGRFLKGNPGGPGNPLSKQANQLRSCLLDAVTEDDFREVVKRLVEQAKAGESWAVLEFFNRTAGKSPQSIDLEIGGASIGILHVIEEPVKPDD
jgi:hypothetical protein